MTCEKNIISSRLLEVAALLNEITEKYPDVLQKKENYYNDLIKSSRYMIKTSNVIRNG